MNQYPSDLIFNLLKVNNIW